MRPLLVDFVNLVAVWAGVRLPIKRGGVKWQGKIFSRETARDTATRELRHEPQLLRCREEREH